MADEKKENKPQKPVEPKPSTTSHIIESSEKPITAKPNIPYKKK